MSDNVIPLSASMAALKKTMQASLVDLEEKRKAALVDREVAEGRAMVMEGLDLIRKHIGPNATIDYLRATLAAIGG